MSEVIQKLRPDRDLQIYFERPSAIAALSQSTPTSFVATGTWRQQFDWCVIEWNRDNVIEHPLFRKLPDGDLSGVQLSYEEERENCLSIDSDIFPTVDWPTLRVWTEEANGVEQLYFVPLRNNATPVEGAYACATAHFELTGTVSANLVAGLAWMGEHHTHVCYATDTLESVAEAIVASVNAFSPVMAASRTNAKITLYYVGSKSAPNLPLATLLAESTTGVNGNQLGAYGHATPGGTLSWTPAFQYFAGGASPTKWRVSLNFGDLKGSLNRFGPYTQTVPTTKVRKMRWTFAADFQREEFQRSEFAAKVTNWQVTGSNLLYRVAGPGSRRIENDHREVEYYGNSWATPEKGNYSNGAIRWCGVYSDGLVIRYFSAQEHELYLGSRMLTIGADIAFRVDNEPQARTQKLSRPGEDVLLRVPFGTYGPGEHTVYITHNGPSGNRFYFDFLEIAIPANTVSDLPPMEKLTAATDWDTDHSLSVSAERTAWMLHSLGFRGRGNYYVGALIFYELYRKDHQFARATVTFSGTPTPSGLTTLTIGNVNSPGSDLVINHLNLFGDTSVTIAKAFELELNRGYTAVRASASGNVLTVYSRKMGLIGQDITIAATPNSGNFTALVSSNRLADAVEGTWTTDTATTPKINRACRDWSREYFRTLKNYGQDVTSAFSLELEHGDRSPEAGISQRYWDGDPCVLNTPAIQTNFSPTNRLYWQEVHKEMAAIMVEAGLRPNMQLGEVQWWYFNNMLPGMEPKSMPYYDEYTKQQFLARYGFPMRKIVDYANTNPADFPQEVELLANLIGEFTEALIANVRETFPDCIYEVLYPTDVNDFPLGRLVNYPANSWIPGKLNRLKTESFSFTFDRNLNKGRYTVEFGKLHGFARDERAFLVGPGDPTSIWKKEVQHAYSEGLESIVLWALDQFCLVGYPMPLFHRSKRVVQTD